MSVGTLMSCPFLFEELGVQKVQLFSKSTKALTKTPGKYIMYMDGFNHNHLQGSSYVREQYLFIKHLPLAAGRAYRSCCII